MTQQVGRPHLSGVPILSVLMKQLDGRIVTPGYYITLII